MNNSDAQMTATVRTAQFIHAAITLGLLSFGAVVAFLMFTGTDVTNTQEITSNNESESLGALGIALQLGGLGLAFLIRGLMGRGAQGQNAAGILMIRHITFIVILEGTGITGIVIGLLTNDPYPLIATVIPLLALLFTWPTRARFDPDYDPREAKLG